MVVMQAEYVSLAGLGITTVRARWVGGQAGSWAGAKAGTAS